MKVSRNTFQTFIVTLSWNCHGFGELNCRHSQIQSILGVASSALTSGRSLRSPSFSTVTLIGVDTLRHVSIPNSRNSERTRVSDLVEHPDHPPSISVTYRGRHPSSPNHHHHPSTWFPIRTPSAVGVSTTADHRVHLCTADHPRVRREECLVSHVEKSLGEPTDSLNFMFNGVFRRWSCQIIGASRT